MDHQKRPSLYLLERCKEVGDVLEFFSATKNAGLPAHEERLVVFLTQLGFWDWELENLLFACTSFAERARAWESTSGPAMAESLKLRGMPVQFAAVKNIKTKRVARMERTRQVVAPMAELNRVIGVWNELLTLCEERVLIPPDERQKLIALGANLLPDLSRYRKALIDISADDTGV